MPKIEVGAPFVFTPCWVPGEAFGRAPSIKLQGTIVSINRAHRHFTVEAKLDGQVIRETFKFSRPER